VDFRILGPLVVCDDEGRPCELASGRQRALLATLLIRPNEVVATDRLIEDLWNGTPPRTAAKALQGLVSQLRRALDSSGHGESVIATRSPGYILRVGPLELDSRRFEQLAAKGRRTLAAGHPGEAAATLREALELWRGPALAEFAFEEFAQGEIARQSELRLACLEDRIDAELALGLHASLVGELEGLVAEHPLRERLRGQLMLALYRSGRQAEALQAYHDVRHALVDELGLEPSESLQRLERAILLHDRALDPAVEAGVKPVGTSHPEDTPADDRAEPRRAGSSGPAPVPTDSVAVIDIEAGALVGHIAVGRRPVAVAVGHGSIWVANADDATVSRIDPDRRVVTRTIGIGAPAIELAAGPDAIWVATGSDGTVVRIDPKVEAVVETIDLRGPDELLWSTTYGLAVDSQALWVATGPRSLLRVDTETAATEAALDVGQVPVDVAVGAGAVWATTLAGKVLRIEPKANAITAETPIAYPVAVASGDEAVWAVDVAGRLWCIDPYTAAVVYTTPVTTGLVGLCHGPAGLWAADNAGGRALRIDPRTGLIAAEVEIGHAPTAVAVGLGAVWLAVQGERAILSGG
jgi:DNA-binding SARP family transcriptional activator/DNA-binding beta-propeller fold protein YncE